MKVQKQFASFDSATFMLQAISGFLQGKDAFDMQPYPKAAISGILLPALKVINTFPEKIRSNIIKVVGVSEAIAPRQLAEVGAEAIAAYAVGMYPQRRYPAIVIGSTNGAMTHLCAALGIPWLPQTFLTLVRRDVPPDKIIADYQFGKAFGALFLERNKDVVLHQMHDPTNDRLMAQRMAYFRFKFRKLPRAYRRFIKNNLEPGGRLIVIECRKKWPVAVVSDRHTFQVGGLGGTTVEEYYNGSPRMKQFLAYYRSPHEKLVVPEPTTEAPEAEWGIQRDFVDDIYRFAQANQYGVNRLVFEEPEDLSPLVADLYRWWYEKISVPANQLFVESFTLLEPYWTLKKGLIPFWLTFNGDGSLVSLQNYLESNAFEHIYLTVFSNTVNAIGIPRVEMWVERLQAYGAAVHLLGIDDKKFPVDVRSQVKYYFDLKQLPQRYPLPESLSLAQFEQFLTENETPTVQYL